MVQSDIQFNLGGCVAYARSRPLGVVADLVRDMLHLSAPDPADDQSNTLQGHLDQLNLADYAMISVATEPATSVSRISRPA